MNVAIVSPEFPPHTNWGGIATFNDALSKILVGMGHSVHVFSLQTVANEKFAKKNILLHGVVLRWKSDIFNKLYFTGPAGFLRSFFKKHFPLTHFIFEWNLFLFIYHRHELKKMDLIHAPSQYAPLLSIMTTVRSPIVIHVQGLLKNLIKYDRDTLDHQLSILLEKKLLQHKKVKKIVACSQFVRKKLLEQYLSVKPKLVHIPNFLDKQTAPTLSSQKFNKNKLLFVGRLEYRKGVDLLAKAFGLVIKDYPSLELTYVGYDPSCLWKKTTLTFPEWLSKQDFFANIKDRVNFLPKIYSRQKLIETMLANSGILVSPSRYEPFGFIVLEAMLTGSIVIGSNQGGMKEIIKKDKTGFVVKPSAENIAHAIKEVMQLTSTQIRNMRQESYQRAITDYCFAGVEQKYIKLYRDLLES